MPDADNTDDDDEDVSRDRLNQLFATTVQLAGLPIAALGIVNLIAAHYHVVLIPLGQDIVTNYRLATHFIVGGLYWLPLHIFHLELPPWFHDLAVISIVSSGVSWRAFAGRDHPLTEWRVSLQTMLTWATAPDDNVSFLDWLIYIVTVVPLFITHLLAWIAGYAVYFVTRVHWLAGVSAASVRVVVRGLFLIGLLIMTNQLIAVVAPVGEEQVASVRRKAALKYFLYFGVVVFAVIFFFAKLGASGLLPK